MESIRTIYSRRRCSHTSTQPDVHSHNYSYAHSNTNSDPPTYLNTHTYQDASPDSNDYTHTDADRNPPALPESDAHSKANPLANLDPHTHTVSLYQIQVIGNSSRQASIVQQQLYVCPQAGPLGKLAHTL